MEGCIKQLFAYSLTVVLLSLPSLAFAQAQTSATPNSTIAETGLATQAGASGDDAIYCRPPQQRPDSVMMGPKVCLTVGKWKELRAKGQDMSADGRTIVPSADSQAQTMPGLFGRP
jgi:hypothetical protein